MSNIEGLDETLKDSYLKIKNNLQQISGILKRDFLLNFSEKNNRHVLFEDIKFEIDKFVETYIRIIGYDQFLLEQVVLTDKKIKDRLLGLYLLDSIDRDIIIKYLKDNS